MFNLVIVDDEKLTREGLLKYVDWNKLEINTIFTVSSGMKALDIMEHNHIDILLSDIKMPKMNGIELATEVRANFPDCKIVFLSGYSDKEYLKSAIQLKVENYIEKPMNLSEIEKVMFHVVKELKKETKKKETEAILVSGLAESIPVMKQEIALSLINPYLDYTAFTKKYAPLYFSLTEKSLLYVCSIIPDETPDRWNKDKKLINEIYIFLENNSVLNPLDFYAGQSIDSSVVLIVNHIESSFLRDRLTNLQQHLYQRLQLTVTIGISSILYDIQSLPAGYTQACLATQKRFYLGENQIILYSKNHGGTLLDTSLFKKLQFNFERVSSLFDILLERQYKDIENIKEYLYKLYCIMMDRTLNQNVMSFSDFTAMTLNQMREFILFGMHALQTLGDDQYDPKVKDAVHYILWNYLDADLNISSIAGSVGLSPNYLCSLFKQNTGSTINDFIIHIRVEKAKKLLRKTDLRLYEICEKVGVTDPNYFSALFKRSYGQTPREYRNSYIGDDNE